MNTTTERLDYASLAPDAFAGMMQTHKYLSTSSLGQTLIELVFLRVSQINGCAFCVDMHAEDLRSSGETHVRLDQLVVWEESPFFSERERAALRWAESLTRLHQTHAPDEDYELVRAHFSERESVDLTLAIATINAWNRFGVGFRRLPASAGRSNGVK
ncbi:MAG: carboxymuconolactone decarboxylase family protein [Vulcanimicrobiaceae bacterium]